MDCGAKATAYDHRDHAKPLDVQPVCDSCNSKRGPAINQTDHRCSFQLEYDLYLGLRKLAYLTGLSMNTLLTDALREKLERESKGN
jgi:hypothetical protein